MLKYYLGGHKQLDSLESRPIQTSSNRNDRGGGGGVREKKIAEKQNWSALQGAPDHMQPVVLVFF